jgi:peptidylprolyl isomerase
MPPVRRPLLLVLALAALMAVAGCGSDSEEPASKSAPEAAAGKPAKAGDQVTVQYVGISFLNGRQFDASWDRGEPFQFQLGAGSVIPGWDQGVEGMKVGGRRQLVIPPDLAYGPQGSPPTIGPNETLVFVIDLLSVG